MLDALAAYRLTRLVTADTITLALRARIIRWTYERKGDTDWIASGTTDSQWELIPDDDDDPPKLATLITCRWCAGMWISGFVIAARRYAPGIWAPIARALALSAAAALVARLEDDG